LFDNIVSPVYNTVFGLATSANNFIAGSNAGDTAITWTNTGNLLFGLTTGAVEKARFTSAGNFLVNTTTDSGQKLQINGTSLFTGTATFNNALNGLTGFFSNTNSNTYAALILSQTSSFNGILQFSSANANYTISAGDYYAGMNFNVVSNAPQIFTTNNVERLRITGSGNLLVGTSTDNGAKLQVNGAISTNGLTVQNGYNINGLSSVAIPTNLTNYQILNYPFFGLLVIRDITFGGSAVYLLDPNAGTNLISSNLGYVLTFTYGAGVWNVQKSTGGSTTLNFLPLQA